MPAANAPRASSRRETYRARESQFPAGYHVQVESFLFNELYHGFSDKSLRRVADGGVGVALAELRLELPTAAAQVRFIKNI
jgi:hypothetical protein